MFYRRALIVMIELVGASKKIVQSKFFEVSLYEKSLAKINEGRAVARKIVLSVDVIFRDAFLLQIPFAVFIDDFCFHCAHRSPKNAYRYIRVKVIVTGSFLALVKTIVQKTRLYFKRH